MKQYHLMRRMLAHALAIIAGAVANLARKINPGRRMTEK
jgi:hypothetical protein